MQSFLKADKRPLVLLRTMVCEDSISHASVGDYIALSICLTLEDQVLPQLYLHLLQQGLPHLLTLLVSPNSHAPQEALTHSIKLEAALTSPCPHSQQRVTCHPENTGPQRPFICLSCVSPGVTSSPTAVFVPPLNPPVGSLPNIPAPPAP